MGQVLGVKQKFSHQLLDCVDFLSVVGGCSEMSAKFTLKSPRPFMSTSLVPLGIIPPPLVLLLLSLTLTMFCPVQRRFAVLCGPSVSQPPLNAIFIQATVSELDDTDKNSVSRSLTLIEFNWKLRLALFAQSDASTFSLHFHSHSRLLTTFNCATWKEIFIIQPFFYATFPPSFSKTSRSVSLSCISSIVDLMQNPPHSIVFSLPNR